MKQLAVQYYSCSKWETLPQIYEDFLTLTVDKEGCP